MSTHPAREPIARLVEARLAGQVGALAARETGAHAGDDMAIHRMRVACRRLRSALATFRPVLDRDRTDPVRDELRWLAGVLGVARDGAVVRDRLRRLVAAEPDPLVHGPVHPRLRSTYLGRGKQEVRVALDSPRYARLRAGLEDLAEDPPWTALADQPARDVVPRLLRRDGKRLRRRARAAAAADRDDALMHDVRKAAKRLRYAAEAVEPAIGKPARHLARDAQRVTKTLGDLQDTVLSRAELLELAREAEAVREPTFTYGLLHAREQARADELVARYCAWDTLDMLKSGTRRAGAAVREK